MPRQFLRPSRGHFIYDAKTRRAISFPGANYISRSAAQGIERDMTRIEVPNITARRRSSGIGRWVTIIVLLLLVGTGLWTWLTLSWAYAEGERAGVLQKFVRRGWVCKTREGEIALYYGGGQYLGPGSSPQLWDFSVRDPVVAEKLNHAVGQRVQLHYTEHPGVPSSCFAETRYYVDRVTIAEGEGGSPTAAPSPQPAPSAQPSTLGSAPTSP